SRPPARVGSRYRRDGSLPPRPRPRSRCPPWRQALGSPCPPAVRTPDPARHRPPGPPRADAGLRSGCGRSPGGAGSGGDGRPRRRPGCAPRGALPGRSSGLLRRPDELGEGLRVAHCHLGEYLPVDLDLGRREAGDQLAVGGPVLTGGRVDAGDPEPAELTLARPAVAVGVLHGVHHLLVGGAETPAACALVALGP